MLSRVRAQKEAQGSQSLGFLICIIVHFFAVFDPVKYPT
jgi:hypothetical protein